MSPLEDNHVDITYTKKIMLDVLNDKIFNLNKFFIILNISFFSSLFTIFPVFLTFFLLIPFQLCLRPLIRSRCLQFLCKTCHLRYGIQRKIMFFYGKIYPFLFKLRHKHFTQITFTLLMFRILYIYYTKSMLCENKVI